MSKVSRRTFLYSLSALGALGCAGSLVHLISSDDANRLHKRTVTKLQMGTFLTITVYNESRTLLDEALEKAFSTSTNAESTFTRHIPDSPLGILNAQGVLRDTPPELISLLNNSLQVSRKTDLAFTPATAPVLDALAAYDVPSIAELPHAVRADLRRVVDPHAINMNGGTVRLQHAGMGISLDGIAKGHIVDLIAEKLEELSVRSYLVNAGGDIRGGLDLAKGAPWDIGIQDAASPGRNITTLQLTHGAMATSGNYESLASRGFNHLVAMQPSRHSEKAPTCTSVCVTAPTCTEADSLATALFVMGIRRGMLFINRNPSYSCLWQTSEGVISSSNWKYAV